MTAPNLKWVALAMFGVLVTAAIAQAQYPQPGANPATQPAATPSMQPQNTQATNAKGNDAELAAWLIVDNHGEVALGKLAEERSNTDSVKKFAKQMVDDHSKFIEKLQPFAGASQSMSKTATPGTLNVVELKQRLGQKCLESARAEMEKKSGADFDRCYLGQQLGAHMMVLDTLEVFKEYASPDLRRVIDEGITTTQHHLKMVKDLYDRAEKGTSQPTSTSSGL